jgi:hypothetical protein
VTKAPAAPARNLAVPSLNGSQDLAYFVGLKALCEAICRGAEVWLVDARRDPNRSAAVDRLKRITRITADGQWIRV